MAKKKQGEAIAPAGLTDGGEVRTINFETTLREVEQVVEQLEGGQLGLTESLAQYERGIEKIKLCHQVLQQAEKRIAVLTGVQEDGTALVEPVDLGDGADGAARRGRVGTSRKGPRKAGGPISDVDDVEGLF